MHSGKGRPKEGEIFRYKGHKYVYKRMMKGKLAWYEVSTISWYYTKADIRKYWNS